jgi:hypothetical protein
MMAESQQIKRLEIAGLSDRAMGAFTRFVTEMAKRLITEIPEKGEDWQGFHNSEALAEIEAHLEALGAAWMEDDREGIKRHAVNVANYAMMVADACGALPETEES